MPTELASPSAATSSPESAQRFETGQLLGDRYRIVSLLGKGGMGEVYRADDRKLDLPVALKFLPAEIERDETRLRRFHDEVRLALKVTHPNVTRTYDIGEVGGRHYIAMEYVDGEDLASLLRRIGRLPGDKAVQVARQICAGLAAAHEQGVLHRDLKPANVMLDGYGRVKITDFGLASASGESAALEAPAGTPAYMAPEQWEGREVSVRSDIYALGLVLYELFTGESVFSGRTPAEIRALQKDEMSTAGHSAGRLEDLDPAIERVITACLETDPNRRPKSALAVAAALPGGDPVAAALAAGETPAPELLANAPIGEGIGTAKAWGLVGAIAVLALGLAWLSDRVYLPGRAALPRPPQYLEVRAGEILAAVGLGELPVADSVSWFDLNHAWVDHTLEQSPSKGRWRVFEGLQPSVYRFHYRQSPATFDRLNPAAYSGWGLDPPAVEPGMVEVVLDPEGRLVELRVVPSPLDLARKDDVEPEWSALLEAAGFTPAALSSIAPATNPPVYADRRRAWAGSYPLSPEVEVTLEAASLGARIVYFRLREPWELTSREADTIGGPTRRMAVGWLLQVWVAVVMATVILLGWRNLKLGRGDLRTALSFGLFTASCRLLAMLAGHPTGSGVGFVLAHLSRAIFLGFIMTVFYVALEPYARRLWPRVLIDWVKLWRGELRDRGVAYGVLVGVFVGLASSVVQTLSVFVTESLGVHGPAPTNWHGDALSNMFLPGLRQTLGMLGYIQVDALFGVVMMQVMLLLLRLALRRTWAAAACLGLLVLVVTAPGGGALTTHIATLAAIFAIYIATLLRFGLLSLVVAVSIMDVVSYLPLTLDLSSWHSSSSLLTLAILAALTTWAALVARADPSGRQL